MNFKVLIPSTQCYRDSGRGRKVLLDVISGIEVKSLITDILSSKIMLMKQSFVRCLRTEVICRARLLYTKNALLFCIQTPTRKCVVGWALPFRNGLSILMIWLYFQHSPMSWMVRSSRVQSSPILVRHSSSSLNPSTPAFTRLWWLQRHLIVTRHSYMLRLRIPKRSLQRKLFILQGKRMSQHIHFGRVS